MAEFNASDPRQIRKAIREDKARAKQDDVVVFNLMSSPAGRQWVLSKLVLSHVFASSFSPNSLAMAFAEGERNIGLQLLNEVMRAAPDQYTQMMREENDRRSASERRSRPDPNVNGRPSESVDDGSIGGVESEYDPGDSEEGDASQPN